MNSGKRSILQKMLYLRLRMIPVKHPFSDFAPESAPPIRKNQYEYIPFDSLIPPFHYPRVHDSNIPEFQHSNWGEAPNSSSLFMSDFFMKFQMPTIIDNHHSCITLGSIQELNFYSVKKYFLLGNFQARNIVYISLNYKSNH